MDALAARGPVRAVRWLPCLVMAILLHALALAGLHSASAPREIPAVDDAPVELQFVATAPRVPPAADLPAQEPPPPATRPEPKPEPIPEPAPQPKPKPEPGQEPERSPEPEAESATQAPPDRETEAATPQPAAEPVPEPRAATERPVARFTGRPARNARAWFGQLAAWIDANKYYPVESKKQKQQGTVVVRFTIDRDGMLLSSSIKTSSGHAELDRAALDALSRAAPFPPIPRFIERETVSVSVPIDYTLVTE